MKTSIRALAAATALATMVGIGCQARDSGEVRTTTQSAPLAKASEVTVTYYYLPS